MIHLRNPEQTGYVLETEIIAGVFSPVVEDNTEYSTHIESYSALKIFVTVINTLLSSASFYDWVLQIKKKIK